jgi:hypothetical protein
MKRMNKKLISKHSERIEKDREDVEREETDGELVTDVLNDFKRELRRGLQDAVHNCLSDSQKDKDEQTQHELLRYELGKRLAKSPEARKQYIQRQREFQQRFKK